MGTISIQVTEAGQNNLTKTYTVSDANIDKITAAYQRDANIFVNGTASRAQVWLWIAENVLKAPIIAKVKAANTVPAIVPSDISLS